jgi:glutathione synthase/RimK-type ligase-like ATP-grasp enzyme
MPKKLVLVPNNMGSRAAKALAQTLSQKLGYKVFRVKPGRERGRPAFKLSPGTAKDVQLNAFNREEVPTVEHTKDRATALSWIEAGDSVMCRRLLRASEGRGIVVADTADQLVAAPLYTRYVKKKAEYRVHVLNGQVIDVQMKRKRRGFEGERDTKVRNLANGYVFCRDNLVEPAGLRDVAIKASAALGYSLGAVDVAFNERNNRLVVLEVNANPGMQGTTLENYANKIVEQVRGTR